MSLTAIIALISGTAGVWLTIKQNIWCWPVSLIAVVCSIVEFYDQKLFGDMSLQVVYFVLGIFGWFYWNKKKREVFLVQKINTKQFLILMVLTMLQAAVYYRLLIYFNGDRPFLDSILTAASLTATYMMTKKWVENWLAWVLIDVAYVLLYCLKDMWLFALLYFLFAAMAFFGWIKWRKTAS